MVARGLLDARGGHNPEAAGSLPAITIAIGSRDTAEGKRAVPTGARGQVRIDSVFHTR
jgi:hypothetical protein